VHRRLSNHRDALLTSELPTDRMEPTVSLLESATNRTPNAQAIPYSRRGASKFQSEQVPYVFTNSKLSTSIISATRPVDISPLGSASKQSST